jgi:hypothetical protein
MPALRFVLPALLASLVVTGLGGCGECVFSNTIRGSLRDQYGQPIRGGTIYACPADRGSLVVQDRSVCTTVQSDDTGAFSIEAPMFRPEPMQCVLGPIFVEKPGCQSATAIDSQPPRGMIAVQLQCEAAPAQTGQ